MSIFNKIVLRTQCGCFINLDMDATRYTATARNEIAAFQVLPLLRAALFGADLGGSTLRYAKLIQFAECIVFEGADFLMGKVDGFMVMARYEALCAEGFADMANLAGRLATLIAAAVRRDRSQALITAKSFNGNTRCLKAARFILDRITFGPARTNVVPMRRAA